METNCIPQDILDKADQVKKNLLPSKSRNQYEKEYELFCEWKKGRNISTVNEDILLAYFSNKSKTLRSSSLWSKYSMLKSTLRAKEDIDIGKFFKLKAFLKQQSVGYEAKKSLILDRAEIHKFMTEAPDETYLLIKVVMLFGICGACRREELYNVSIHDIKDHNEVLIVTIPDTKTNQKRVFTITNEMDGINPIDLYRKYRALRPGHVNHDKLFIYYKANKCTVQRVGVHTIAKIPSQIATFLKLPNSQQYTGHCFRRTSASILADAGADLVRIKRHGGWKSSSVAEGYLEDSIENKKKCTKMILESQKNVVRTIGNAEKASDSSSMSFFDQLPSNITEENTLNLSSASLSNAGLVFKEVTNCTFNFHINK